METTYTFGEAPGGGTRMTLRNRGEPAGFQRMAAPLMERAMRRANAKDLARLKRILRSHPRRVEEGVHPPVADSRPMDLHPGEQILFEGHPSWRGLLSFYIGGIAGALVIAFDRRAGGEHRGSPCSSAAVLIAVVILGGLIKRMATDYTISTQRLYIRRGILSKRGPADPYRPGAERQHRAVASGNACWASGRSTSTRRAPTTPSSASSGSITRRASSRAVDKAQREAAVSPGS